jgi:hypothetical protein
LRIQEAQLRVSWMKCFDVRSRVLRAIVMMKAQTLACNTVLRNGTKHADNRHYFISEAVEHGRVI